MVQASDTDGDTLTYALSATSPNTVPAGMTIDPNSGHISWSPGIAQIGSYPG